MPIVQQGSTNTTALVVPNVYVQIISPTLIALNGVPTNILGVVGTATWGPVGQPTTIGTYAEYAAVYGPLVNRKYDMGTHVAIAVQQGAQDMVCVRVTDGTDAAATIPLAGTVSVGVILTSLYTGTLGNSIVATISVGSRPNTFAVTITMPGFPPEIYNNITGPAGAFWTNMVAAINNGNNVLRGQSQIVVASLAGSYVTTPTPSTVTLTGGVDGVATLTAAVLVGVDTVPRKGMYGLRSQNCSIGILADADDSTQWTTIDGFGQQEGIYMMQVFPAGTSITAAVTAKGSAGIDSYSTKMMHGDWIYWNDPVNGLLRLVSPQPFVGGLLSNLAPNQSSLNKQLYGVVGSQKSGVPNSLQINTYSTADVSTLFTAGIDVIANPAPGGTYWAVRRGCNSSSNVAINGDNYTRMTNYIAATLNAGMGVYVGLPITMKLLQNVRATQLGFLANLLQQGLLGTVTGALPYAVKCDADNNPLTRTSLGYVQSDAQVQYESITLFLILNIQGGQTVQPTVTIQQNGP